MPRASFHPMKESTGSPSRTRSIMSKTRPSLAGLFAAALAVAPLPAPAESFALQAGNYDIAAQMVMPHMDEMRRIVTREQRCVGSDPVALFPVLRQPALGGCSLGYGVRDSDSFRYVLVCETARVATGTARLSNAGDRIVGTLEVKMGGKNMTFSQHVEAVPAGGCHTPE